MKPPAGPGELSREIEEAISDLMGVSCPPFDEPILPVLDKCRATIQSAIDAARAEGRREMAREARDKFAEFPAGLKGDRQFSDWLRAQAEEK